MTGKLYQFVLVESQQRAYLIKKKIYTQLFSETYLIVTNSVSLCIYQIQCKRQEMLQQF